jgi:hypothetical protein
MKRLVALLFVAFIYTGGPTGCVVEEDHGDPAWRERHEREERERREREERERHEEHREERHEEWRDNH